MSSTSDENISSKPSTTRVGRRTRPRLVASRKKTPDDKSKSWRKKQSRVTKRSNSDEVNFTDTEYEDENFNNMTSQTPIMMTQEQLQMLCQNLTSNTNRNANTDNANTLHTTLRESSLPHFAGRRRKHDRHFSQTQTFGEFLRDAEAFMLSQRITDDREKINILSVLADKTVGDFNSLMSEIKTGHIYQGMTYNEVVNHLKCIYATTKDKTSVDSFNAFLKEATVLLTDRTLVHQYLCSYHATLDSALEFFQQANPAQRPVRTPEDTDETWNNKMKEHENNVIREFNFRTFWGGKVSAQVNKKAFEIRDGEKRKYHASVKQYTDAILETPNTVKCLVGENLKVLQPIGELQEHQGGYYDRSTVDTYQCEAEEGTQCDYEEDEPYDEEVSDAYYVNSNYRGRVSHSRGRGNGRGRGGRVSSYRPNQLPRGAPQQRYYSGYLPDENNYPPSQRPTRGMYGQGSTRAARRGGKNYNSANPRLCYRCGKAGHVVRDCRYKKSTEGAQEKETQDSTTNLAETDPTDEQ